MDRESTKKFSLFIYNTVAKVLVIMLFGSIILFGELADSFNYDNLLGIELIDFNPDESEKEKEDKSEKEKKSKKFISFKNSKFFGERYYNKRHFKERRNTLSQFLEIAYPPPEFA